MGTKDVFLSSVSQGLEIYRNAVYRAIEGMEGYHCVRMEDFGAHDADSDTFCHDRVARCDMFLGILGHQYGSIDEGSGASYSEREFDAAQQAGIPCLMFLAPDNFPVQAHLREDDAKWRRQQDFRERVKNTRLVAFFSSEDELGRQVLQAVHNCESQLRASMDVASIGGQGKTWLLFPFVTNQVGYDTGIAIANVSMDPFGTQRQAGGVHLYFYGANAPASIAITPIAPGTLFASQMSALAANFQGYLIAECEFCPARGYAYISKLGGGDPTGYLAEVIRTASVSQSGS
jgi:hypothetical protein